MKLPIYVYQTEKVDEAMVNLGLAPEPETKEEITDLCFDENMVTAYYVSPDKETIWFTLFGGSDFFTPYNKKIVPLFEGIVEGRNK
jgi:hypothetical protein